MHMVEHMFFNSIKSWDIMEIAIQQIGPSKGEPTCRGMVMVEGREAPCTCACIQIYFIWYQIIMPIPSPIFPNHLVYDIYLRISHTNIQHLLFLQKKPIKCNQQLWWQLPTHCPQKYWYTIQYSNPQLSKPSNIHSSRSILPPLCLVVMMGIIISMMKKIPVFR